jgi:hypothetical protein
MQRPTNVPRNQLALCLEPQARSQLDVETSEALIAALAELLLEAYGPEADAETAEQGVHHER